MGRREHRPLREIVSFGGSHGGFSIGSKGRSKPLPYRRSVCFGGSRGGCATCTAPFLLTQQAQKKGLAKRKRRSSKGSRPPSNPASFFKKACPKKLTTPSGNRARSKPSECRSLAAGPSRLAAGASPQKSLTKKLTTPSGDRARSKPSECRSLATGPSRLAAGAFRPRLLTAWGGF